MNILNSFKSGKAVLEYLDGDFDVIEPGAYVECAVTGKKIPLEALKYWSVDRQEAYADAATANEAIIKAMQEDGKW
ncbi:DUF2093 domain-containing protein [Parvularcula flava]|uniref:DUF2093 domain-containing protein n=1 Tax=Aquisalinus luteolus TaxID=1566827 RepID=A0A8J3A9B3_9PROT|nr:DUF2093 domain-containing protein [Aquisalinus luteolus]NHK28657.1 DUF2093 domain-containing protein [Aquisalinus luteolus]GGH99131.1 hypothetical protein GCM10011355_24360 [Aquisalinus luteolus]